MQLLGYVITIINAIFFVFFTLLPHSCTFQWCHGSHVFLMIGTDYYLEITNLSLQLLSVQLPVREVTARTYLVTARTLHGNCTEMLVDWMSIFSLHSESVDSQLYQRVGESTNIKIERNLFKFM